MNYSAGRAGGDGATTNLGEGSLGLPAWRRFSNVIVIFMAVVEQSEWKLIVCTILGVN